MSTKLTTEAKKSPQAQFDLPNSHSLSLTMAMDDFQKRMIEWLLARLIDQGFTDLSAGHLTFLGALDCGPNHAAELARGLGISRQAVHKKIKELENLGWLQTVSDTELGNQRVILFTTEGERMMSCARQHFAKLDDALLSEFSQDEVELFKRFLEFVPPE